MKIRLIVCLLAIAAVCLGGSDVAQRIARAAKEAENSGQIVRAYLLYAAAAARDPTNAGYRASRDALEPAAKLLSKADIQKADITDELAEMEKEAPSAEPPLEITGESDWSNGEKLKPIPKLEPLDVTGAFDIRGDEKFLFNDVAKVYGLRPIFDPDLEMHPNLHFTMNGVNFRTVMEALTAATDTFMFPVSDHEFYVAHDTEQKRNELEPQILLTFPLTNALDQRDLVEAANVVRSELSIRSIGYDSATRIVMVRDRYTRAITARDLLEALLLPRGQVSFDVRFLSYNSDRSYQYGMSLPTSVNELTFLPIAHFMQLIPSSISSGAPYLVLGGGPYAGLGLAMSASLFATYSETHSQILYDATVVVADGQTANLHIGDKYPIPQTTFSGATTAGTSSIYNPIGQVTLEDLGIILKLTPRINGDGEISLDLEAAFKSLGSLSIDGVPSINQSEFKGNVTMREGEWAVVAGLDSKSVTVSRTGIAGLSSIPVLNQIFSQNNRDTNISDTLLVIKPTITRLPMSPEVSPQFYIGTMRGERVLL